MSKERKLQLIQEAVGHASMSWHETPAAVFDPEQALRVADKLYADLFPGE